MNAEKKEFRLLITKDKSAYMNMAIDEAVTQHVKKGIVPPTLRLYSWSPAAVSIGYFQSLKDEIDLEACKKFGVDYVRRITGGGAVFHDTEITYSFIIKKDDGLVPAKILDSYKFICEGIIIGMKKLGIESQFVPLNDIVSKSNGKKISGNAQTRKESCILQHGTILLNVDVAKMFSLLLIPDEKIKDKMISVASERVIGISTILDREIGFEESADVLIAGFSEAFGVNFVKAELTDSELEMAEKLASEKYSQDEWNFKR